MPADGRKRAGGGGSTGRPPPNAPGGPRVHIGTSGWYYEHWRGHLYPEDLPKSRFLEHYTRSFSTVELNNSFYRLPAEKTFAGWREATPPGFLFAVKASRYLTHLKRLLDPQEPLLRLFERVQGLREKLGPLLYQLPPRFAPDLSRLETFLEALPPERTHVVEFRDRRWLQEPVYEALRRHGVGLCLYQWEDFTSPLVVTAPPVYVRFHGPGKAYRGSYTDYDLRAWAERVSAWRAEGLEVYCYFNNDPGGHAVRNAHSLIDLVHSAGGRPSLAAGAA
jgi:uncharacterized protein YecE (DUF72 family)